MWQKSKPYLFIAPATILLGWLFIGGMINGLFESVGIFSFDQLSRFSLAAYKQLVIREDFLSSLWLTLRIAFLSTLLAGVIAFAIAMLITHLQLHIFWRRVIQLPLTIPHFVGAYFMVTLLMQSGLLARIAYWVGWIHDPSQFPILVNDQQGWGIVFTYVWKETPFILLFLEPIVTHIYRQWQEVAHVFGAGTFAFCKTILFPLVFPAWLSACLIVFAFTFSAFEVPFLLGVTYPQLLPVFSYQLFANGTWSDRPEALAVNVILTLVTTGIGLLAYWLGRRYQARFGGGQEYIENYSK